MKTDGLCDLRTRGQEAGFTLVEVLIAIVVFAFGLIAVTNLLLVGATSNRVGNDMTAAATSATLTMDNLKALPFGDAGLAIGGDVNADVANFFRDDVVAGVPGGALGHGAVHVRWQIEAPAGNAGQVRFIRVRAEGTGLAGSRSRVEFTTFRSCTNTLVGCPAAP